jgi:hypothetical protein
MAIMAYTSIENKIVGRIEKSQITRISEKRNPTLVLEATQPRDFA